MSRKALYDLETVLNQSIDLLLQRGFHAAAMDEIIARTDFNRRGFYIEFGSKQQFLYKVVEHYQATRLNPVVDCLQSHQGIEAINQFFDRYISLIAGRGCLLINLIGEMGSDDEVIRDLGRHYLDRLQIAFIGCLERAQKHGQLSDQVNLEACALQLSSYVQGFAINAIIAADEEEMRIAAGSLLQAVYR